VLDIDKWEKQFGFKDDSWETQRHTTEQDTGLHKKQNNDDKQTKILILPTNEDAKIQTLIEKINMMEERMARIQSKMDENTAIADDNFSKLRDYIMNIENCAMTFVGTLLIAIIGIVTFDIITGYIKKKRKKNKYEQNTEGVELDHITVEDNTEQIPSGSEFKTRETPVVEDTSGQRYPEEISIKQEERNKTIDAKKFFESSIKAFYPLYEDNNDMAQKLTDRYKGTPFKGEEADQWLELYIDGIKTVKANRNASRREIEDQLSIALKLANLKFGYI